MVVDTSWRSFDWRGRGRDSMCTATVQLPDALSLMQTTWTTIPLLPGRSAGLLFRQVSDLAVGK
jgi:hypothetical protein